MAMCPANWKRPRPVLSALAVAVLCLLLQAQPTAAHPAPPSDLTEQQLTLLDAERAPPAPITEEELHLMIEDLLMEAYGDEYEPPATQFEPISVSKPKSLPAQKPKRVLLQAGSLGSSKPKTPETRSKSFLTSLSVPERGRLSAIVSSRPQTSRPFLPQPDNKERSKSNSPQPVIRPAPLQSVSFLPDVPDVRMKLSPTTTSTPLPIKTTAKISKLSSNVMPSTVPERIAQTLTTSDLMGAVLVEQDDQPNILIVDRRTKNKEAKVLNSAKSLNEFQRNSRSPVATNAPTSSPVLASVASAPAADSVAAETSDITSLVRPATLLSHIKSEGNTPFKFVGSNAKQVTSQPRRNKPSPVDLNVIQPSPVSTTKPQTPASLINVIQSLPTTTPKPQTSVPFITKQNSAKSFSSEDLFDSPNAFTLPNLQPVNNPRIRPILDLDDVDDEDLLLLELLGSRMNKAGFGSDQSITPAVRLGSTSNSRAPTSTRKSSTGRQQTRGNSIVLDGTSQPRVSAIPGVFSDDDKVVIDLAAVGGGGTPLPLLTGNNNNQGNFFTAKEIGTDNRLQSNRPSPTRVDSLGPQIDAQMTVGDLIRSLDGLNGIQVLSLSDLRKQQNSDGSSASSTGSTIAEHLRAAIAPQTSGAELQSVGVPLPDLGVSNSVTAQGAVQVASENPGRQFEQNNAFESDSTFDNFFDESTGTSGTADDVGIPLAAVADNVGSVATTSGAVATTLDDTNGFPLEENTDFNFDEYEDDLDDLPAQPESVFRRGISDIFFTKGQWLGTLLGGVVDIGSSIGESVSKLFNKSGSNSSS